jgi:hypothetical protein
MVLDLYLNVNKHRHDGYTIDYLCIAHFLFGYALYMLRFPLVYAITFDIVFQLLLRTERGFRLAKDIFGDTIKADQQLTYRYCDTLFIGFGWWVGKVTLNYNTEMIGNVKSNMIEDVISNFITTN